MIVSYVIARSVFDVFCYIFKVLAWLMVLSYKKRRRSQTVPPCAYMYGLSEPEKAFWNNCKKYFSIGLVERFL